MKNKRNKGKKVDGGKFGNNRKIIYICSKSK